MKRKGPTKRRFIGVEFKLNGVPKDELDSLQIGLGILDGKFQAIIKTDKRAIPTNAVKAIRKDGKLNFTVKKIFHKSDSGSLEPSSFLDDIERLFAIDTNSKVILGRTYQVGVVAELQIHNKGNGLCDALAVGIDYLPFTDDEQKSENRTWKIFIESYSTKKENERIKTAIVVDSDLGSIDKFNRREAPIYDNYYLPENVLLIYASADFKNDSLINKLIAFCDDESTKSLRELEANLTKEFFKLSKKLIKKYPENIDEINQNLLG